MEKQHVSAVPLGGRQRGAVIFGPARGHAYTTTRYGRLSCPSLEAGDAVIILNRGDAETPFSGIGGSIGALAAEARIRAAHEARCERDGRARWWLDVAAVLEGEP